MTIKKERIFICINCGRRSFYSELGLFIDGDNALRHYCPLCFEAEFTTFEAAKQDKTLGDYRSLYHSNEFEVLSVRSYYEFIHESPIENRRDIVEKREAARKLQEIRATREKVHSETRRKEFKKIYGRSH